MSALTRRAFIKNIGFALATTAGPLFGEHLDAAFSSDLASKIIPSSGQKVVPIGMGTWQTFNVGNDQQLRDERTKVLRTFFSMGGELVDSSPMYGSSQKVLGYALKALDYPTSLFSADKIWTSDGKLTSKQANETRRRWGVSQFDLLQVHNLLNWEEHLTNLKRMKQNGKIKYLGITTSHGRRHSEVESIMKTHPLDFVQLTYNLEDRAVEQRLLPLALEKGIAVIANRPFQGGRLISHLKKINAALPKWSMEFQCNNWPQLLLKFITSHPAVTYAIPATRKVAHMKENMGAITGPLLDAKTRQRLISYVANI